MSTSADPRGTNPDAPFPLPPDLRWKAVAVRDGSSVAHDIVEDHSDGAHVASAVGYAAYGETCERTLAHAAAIAAAPFMLTVLVELLAGRERGYDLGWGRVTQAVLLGAGAPCNGAAFVSRFDEVSPGADDRPVVTPAGSRWTVLRSDFSDPDGVTVLIAAGTGHGWARLSLSALRARFQSVDD